MDHSSVDYFKDLINPSTNNYEYLQPETLSEIDRINALQVNYSNDVTNGFSESDPMERVIFQNKLETIAKISGEENENKLFYDQKENDNNLLNISTSPMGKFFVMFNSV